MRKNFFLTLLAVLTTIVSHAGNYPDRADYLWITVPDHANWLYETGQKATIEVQFYKYGIPRDAEITYEIADDMLSADQKGSTKLKDGRTKINIGTRRTPGFRDLRLTATVDGTQYKHHIKVGFSVDKIKPWTTEPKDFKAFWKKQIDDMHSTPLSYTKELAKEYCTDRADCYLVKLKVNNLNQCIYGYLFIPKNAAKGSCPAVFCPPGAGIKTIKEPLRHRYYADNGMIRFEIEIHGLDPRMSQEQFKEISNAFNSRDNGYLENGIESRNRYYMLHVYQAMVRSLDLLTSLPEWDGRNLAVQGGSQGGALAIITAGLDERVTLCCANHPALSDMGAYSAGLTGGYPHFNRIEGILTPAALQTLQYYDVVNFACYVKCPTRMTWGYNDDTCPPTTSYAVWNTLTCQKESLITPINEHWTSETTERGHMEWIKSKLK